MRTLVLALLLLALVQPAVQSGDKPQGFENLFNGTDLTGWKVNEEGNAKVWGANNGVLFVDGKGGGWLMTEKEYADFDLRLEYKVPAGGNSGVALRSPMKGNPAYAGMEIQILDDSWYKDPAHYKGIRPTQLTGSIYDVVPPSQEAVKPAGQWNKMRIVAAGRRVSVELNGIKVVDADLDQHKDRAGQHPGLLRARGHLGLQSHDGRVEFRNLYVKEQ